MTLDSINSHRQVPTLTQPQSDGSGGRKFPIAFGRYLLLAPIAAGGMAEVFLAELNGPMGFARRLAVKRILPHLVNDTLFVQSFIDEAKVGAQLTHPHIVKTEDLTLVDGQPCLAMEYVEGGHFGYLIQQARQRQQPLPLAFVQELTCQVARGLDFAHNARNSRGRPLHLIHRDIKPSNLLLGFDGQAKLVDFGIARASSNLSHTQPATVKGSLPYMSPEQASGDGSLTPASDLFSLGAVLFELLTLERLYQGDSQGAVLYQVSKGPSPVRLARLDALHPEAEPLTRICRTLLSPRVSDRFGSAQALLTALELAPQQHLSLPQMARLAREWLVGVRLPQLPPGWHDTTDSGSVRRTNGGLLGSLAANSSPLPAPEPAAPPAAASRGEQSTDPGEAERLDGRAKASGPGTSDPGAPAPGTSDRGVSRHGASGHETAGPGASGEASPAQSQLDLALEATQPGLHVPTAARGLLESDRPPSGGEQGEAPAARVPAQASDHARGVADSTHATDASTPRLEPTWTMRAVQAWPEAPSGVLPAEPVRMLAPPAEPELAPGMAVPVPVPLPALAPPAPLAHPSGTAGTSADRTSTDWAELGPAGAVRSGEKSSELSTVEGPHLIQQYRRELMVLAVILTLGLSTVLVAKRARLMAHATLPAEPLPAQGASPPGTAPWVYVLGDVPLVLSYNGQPLGTPPLRFQLPVNRHTLRLEANQEGKTRLLFDGTVAPEEVLVVQLIPDQAPNIQRLARDPLEPSAQGAVSASPDPAPGVGVRP